MKNYPPVRVKAMRYSGEQREFLDAYMRKLLDLGLCEEIAMASWQPAPLLVQKKDSRATFRLSIDLRPVKTATVKESWPMPHLDSEILDFQGSACFAVLDFVSAYRQLPLHPDSYTLCGIVCPKGMVVSRRVLLGAANTTLYFQSTVEPLFQEMQKNMNAWLDDFNLHAGSEEDLLLLLGRFFQICKQYVLFLSARKCIFFSEKLRWCGRIIKGNSHTLDPSSIQGLIKLIKGNGATKNGRRIITICSLL